MDLHHGHVLCFRVTFVIKVFLSVVVDDVVDFLGIDRHAVGLIVFCEIEHGCDLFLKVRI